MLIGKYSSSAHELVLQFLSWSLMLAGRSRPALDLPDVLLQLCAVEAQPGRSPEGPAEGSASQRQLETVPGGVQVRSPARRPSTRIRHEREARTRVRRDDAHQLGLGSAPPAPHA